MVIVLKKGESFPGAFTKELEKRGVTSGFFFGLGGFLEADLAFYDLEQKKYIVRPFDKGPYEVLGLTGNIAKAGDKLVVHAHSVLGTRDYTTIGGHVQKAVVGGTLEIFVGKLGAQLEREKDNETGLSLLR
jgi:uncharacterized protein